MNRREFLASSGTVLASVSGCVGTVSDPFNSALRLGWLGVSNYDTSSHRFQIRVERRNEVVHESTHTVRGREESVVYGNPLECTWGSSAATFVLHGRVDDADWVEQPLNRAIDGTPDCVTARGVYDDWKSKTFEFYVRAGCERVAEYDGGCSFTDGDA